MVSQLFRTIENLDFLFRAKLNLSGLYGLCTNLSFLRYALFLYFNCSKFLITAPYRSSCCASRFTWASTSDSEAQEARDKHNCRSCGSLVCAPCSNNRFPLPSMGISSPVRVCDRCYNDMACVIHSDGNDLTQSFICEDESKECDESLSSEEGEASSTNPRKLNDQTSSNNHSGLASNADYTDESMVKKERFVRQRRSNVVDELASRLHQLA